MTILEERRSTSNAITKPDQIRRSMEPPGSQVKNSLRQTDSVLVGLIIMVVCLVLFPASFLLAVPATFTHYLWATSPRYRLPFRMPINWGGTDFSLRHPSGKGFRKAEGILFLGNHYETGAQLWLTNSDARRHAFVLGTTGSGKALTVDTLVKTPWGMKPAGELAVGDELVHPSGKTTKVTSVHPQGRQGVVTLEFVDGRRITASHDHLFTLRLWDRANGLAKKTQVMTAAEIAISMTGTQGKMVHFLPFIEPFNHGPAGEVLGKTSLEIAIEKGAGHLFVAPDRVGTPAERRKFLAGIVTARGMEVARHGASFKALNKADAKALQSLVWSLGGTAFHIEMDGDHHLHFNLPRFKQMFPGSPAPMPPNPAGLEIVGYDEGDTSETADTICIKTSRNDGLFVVEDYLVTHNTEMLLGLASQSLMWSSGFIFVDGKGTPQFASRIWSLCKRFGREDDYRVINFTDGGDDPDAPAGGPAVQSNTMNPFNKGTADQIMNLLVSLMGDAGSGNDMWKNRAMSLISAQVRCLVELRDNGDILLDVQTIRDFLPLGDAVPKKSPKAIKTVNDLSEEQMAELRSRAGMISLYIRALRGEFSNASLLALKGFFDTLPGFNLEKSLNGEPQDTKALEQYSFLSMQLTKPTGSMADDFGHIFRTPLGEVDMEDVVFNRRILVVLLPALQKAPDELRNCGKIVVAMIRQMMGYASGSRLDGKKRNIIDASPTKSASPFIIVLDEIGYYMVEGVDVMLAQGRSLGICLIPAGQDMAAMGKVNKQIAESVSANARLTAFGAMEDGNSTLEFMTKKVGQHKVAVASGYTTKTGLINSRLVDRQDVSFETTARVTFEEMQSLSEGEFYFVFEGILVKARTFYIGENFTEAFSVNKFLRVRGPMDRVPGLDQSVEERLYRDIRAFAPRLGNLKAMRKAAEEEKEDAIQKDILTILGVPTLTQDKTGQKPVYPTPQVRAILAEACKFQKYAREEETVDVEDMIDDVDTFDASSVAQIARPKAPPVLPSAADGQIGQVRQSHRMAMQQQSPWSDNPDLAGFQAPPEADGTRFKGDAATVGRIFAERPDLDAAERSGSLLKDNPLPSTAEPPDPLQDTDPRIQHINGIVGSIYRQIAELEAAITNDHERGAALTRTLEQNISAVASPVPLEDADPAEYIESLTKLSRYLDGG